MAKITTEPMNQQGVELEVAAPSSGALLTFTGTVRDEHLGRSVVGIEYHAYEPMALRELERIENEAVERWPGARIRVVHRIGLLKVGEASVFIAVSSPHRSEGFEALRFAIEQVKESVPIWKKEMYPDGHAWIEGS